MQQVLHTLSIQSAIRELPLLNDLLSCLAEHCPEGQGAAFVVPKQDWPAALSVDSEMLLLVLPAQEEEHLQALAVSDLGVYNVDSADMKSRDTVLALSCDQLAVESSTWETNFPNDGRRFFIGLIAGNTFVLARHVNTADEAEALIAGLQGASISTGPNYVPEGYYDEAALLDANVAVDEPCPQSPWAQVPAIRCNTVTLQSGS